MAIVVCPNCGAKNRVDENAVQRATPKCGRCHTALPIASEPIVVTDATFQQFLNDAGNLPALIDCWAPWCGPCRMLTPTINELAREGAGKWVIGKLNVDENPRTAAKFNLSSIPAMLIFRHGELRDQLIGLQPRQVISQALRDLSTRIIRPEHWRLSFHTCVGG